MSDCRIRSLMFEVKESQLVDAALLSLHVYVCGNIQQLHKQQTTKRRLVLRANVNCRKRFCFNVFSFGVFQLKRHGPNNGDADAHTLCLVAFLLFFDFQFIWFSLISGLH